MALGTSKAQGTKSTTSTKPTSNNNNNNNNTSSTFSKITKELFIYYYYYYFSVSHLSAVDQELKIKVQELRLYETVLTQRIHSIKSIANDTPIPDVKVYLVSFSFYLN